MDITIVYRLSSYGAESRKGKDHEASLVENEELKLENTGRDVAQV